MEDYKKILAIAGKSGLFRLVGQMKNGVVAESLEDGKRFPVFISENISSLEDISIYTEEGEFPLKKVFVKIHETQSGKAIKIDFNQAEEVKKFFTKILPNYDSDRVYVSDMKKTLKWYNSLLEKNLLILDSGDQKESKKDKEEPEGKAKKATTAKKTNANTKPTKTTKASPKVTPKAPPKKVTTPRKAS